MFFRKLRFKSLNQKVRVSIPLASKKRRQDEIFDLRYKQLLHNWQQSQESMHRLTVQINELATRNLKDYNYYKDKEFETLLENKLYMYLDDNGWEATEIRNVNCIYNSSGVELTFFNGIIFGTHPSYPGIGFIFYLEVKQVFNVNEYNTNFVTKIPILNTILDELSVENNSSNTFYLKMRRNLNRHLRNCKGFKVLGIIGSPSIDASLNEILIQDQVSTITLSADQYIVNLHIK